VNFTYFRRWHSPNHPRLLIYKRQIHLARDKGISVTFNRRDFADHRRQWIYKRQTFILRETRELDTLSIDGVVQMIDDDWPRKDRGSFEDREKWISLTFDRGEFADHCQGRIYKRPIYSMLERSESHSPSIDGIVQNIVDDQSTKDKFNRGETSELDSVWSTRVCRSLSKIDLERTE
jgi:hypothetical protein